MWATLDRSGESTRRWRGDLLAETSHIVDILDIKPGPFGEVRAVLDIRRPPLGIGVDGGVTGFKPPRLGRIKVG